MSRAEAVRADRGPRGLSQLWQRQLDHYPDNGPRTVYLGITVLATIVLYYELYVQGAVATQIIHEFGFTFREFVFISVAGNLLGAFASLLAGLADRWGRANLVVVGLFATGLLIGFGIPSAGSGTAFAVMFILVSIVEGVVLVATPALIRDFSPQMGRATAMGFWALGPVLGSLLVTGISSNTLDTNPDWRFQFYVCGAIGLAVGVVALLGLRELSPNLRDQLMVSMRDRALIEARAAGIRSTELQRGHWGQMMKADILVSALAISLFLLFYYILVGFVVIYFATTFGYSEARANGLANWYWATNAVALVVTGLLSDRFLVRKPFMILGALLSMVGVSLFALAATRPDTTSGQFILALVLASAGGGMAYVAWMASYTETVERRNPAATATGLAVWGWIVRSTVTVSLIGLTVALPATSTLVDKGSHLQEIVARYPAQVQVLQTVDPGTLAALKDDPEDARAQVRALTAISKLSAVDVARTVRFGATYKKELATAAAIDPATLRKLGDDPTDAGAVRDAVRDIARKEDVSDREATDRLIRFGAVPPADLALLNRTGADVAKAGARLRSISEIPPADLAFLSENSADVVKAQRDNPQEWQNWWWICVFAQALFLPAVFVMAGRWSSRKAKQDAAEHEAMVAAELAALPERVNA